MSTTDLIQSILALLTIIGLIVSIWYNQKQVRILSSQLRLNFFAEYTRRYQQIILNFPESINHPHFNYDSLEKADKDRTLRYMRAYFDLCSEEYDLWKAGNIEVRIWNNWKAGIEFAFSKKAFRDAWRFVKEDTVYYSEFSAWVEGLVKAEK